MADSKFLRWQDMDRDGLIDECDDLIIEEPTPCLNCSPNPKAVVPDWKKKTIDEPFLNEMYCHYRVTKVTRYESTVPRDLLTDETADRQVIIDALTARFDEFADEAIESILNWQNKDTSRKSVNIVREALDYKKYWLGARTRSRLKLLYSVPFDVIFDLPDAEDAAADPEEDEPGVMWVHYEAVDISTKMIRMRKSLWLYNRYLKAYRAMGEGNMFYWEDSRLFNLDLYGDSAVFGPWGALAQMMEKLEAFFNANQMQLPGVEVKFAGGWFKDRVIRFKCKFDNYKLKTMAVWTENCGSKPSWFWGSKIKPLADSPPWRDKTAVAYFAQLYPIDASLNARVQIPWQDFLIKYTYPKIYTTINNSEGDIDETVISCIGEALADEAKELGQDILDEVLSLGDVIAHQFNKNICRYDYDELKADEEGMGLRFAGQPVNKGNLFAMAQMQAFKELDASDQVFTQLCAHVLGGAMGIGSATSKMDTIWEHGFERIKLCGLFDLLMDAIKCLLGGVTLEEFLGIALKNALQAMSIENFGELFIGLPPDKQAELDAMVKKKLENNDMFGEGSDLQQVSDSIEGTLKWEKPWENEEAIAAERGRSVQPQQGAGGVAPMAETRTLGQALDVRPGPGDIPADNIMSAYIGALLDVFGENLLALVDELNKFPGAQIITNIIASLDCPVPALFHPSLMDWIKDIGFQFCRGMNEIRGPHLENPFDWFADWKSWMKILLMIIKEAILQALLNIMFKLLLKLCQILGDAICAMLELGGDIAGSLPGMMSGRTTLGEVIRESICGEDASDERVNATIEDLFGQLGLGGAALADQNKIQTFAEDISSTTTKRELAGAFLGEPETEFLEVVDQLIEFEYPEYREALPNRDSIGRFMENIGNVMPADFRDQLRAARDEAPANTLSPANPSICASPEKLENFRQLREDLLGGRATPEQATEMFEDLRTGWLEDLDSLSSIMQNGIPQYIESELNSVFPGGIISEPGCDNGMLPSSMPMVDTLQDTSVLAVLDRLKRAYATDMLGNGNIFNADPSWGLMNMTLSDTEGNPLTAHHRKNWNRKAYVDFATNIPNGGGASTGFMSAFQRNAGFSQQHGQFPRYVGSWLMRQFLNAGDGEHPGGQELGFAEELSNSMDFNSQNNWKASTTRLLDYEDFQANTLFGKAEQINVLGLPDFGYNTPFSLEYIYLASLEEYVPKLTLTKKARKGVKGGKGYDIMLDYKDNAAGLRKGCARGTNEGGDSVWSYGYEVEMFLSDIAEVEEPQYKTKKEYDPEGTLLPQDDQIFVGWKGTGLYTNRSDDNARIKIIEKINTGADIESPLAELVGSKFEKSDGLDLPNWIEGIPIVGWALQAILNLLIKPFSSLIRQAAGAGGPGMGEDIVLKMRKYEFLAVDNGLDGFTKSIEKDGDGMPALNWDDYPNFAQVFHQSAGPFIPQVVLLGDILANGGASSTLSSVKSAHDDYMNDLFKSFSKEIGENEMAWKYGADYDYLMPSDTEYVIPEGQEGAGSPYGSLQVKDEDGDNRGVENDDMIMGVSLNQYLNQQNGTPENTRVFYLDPMKFGGSYMSPPIYIKPVNYEGWLGLVQVLFPEYTPCKPHNIELVNFDEIESKASKRKHKIPNDPRLKQDEECVLEVPYNRILDRNAASGIFTIIEAAIRVYASVHFFKAAATFSKIQPKFPENFSNIYSSYLVEAMEEGFMDAQGPFGESFNTFKDDEFWYAFLEMSVQFYGWRVDNEEILNPPASVIAALQRLNNAQEAYDYPWREDLKDAKRANEVSFFKTLKNYRSSQNLEAVRHSEEDAKLILKELVNEQLTYMGETLNKNLRAKGFIPTIFDLDYWLFANHSNGSTLQFHGPEFKEIIVGLPDGEDETELLESFYTNGTELRVSIDNDDENAYELGDAYIGYYHLEQDEWGDITYVAGESTAQSGEENTQDILRPIADKIQVGTVQVGKFTDPENRNDIRYTHDVILIGDLPEYGTAASEDKIYTIEKYISINGTKMSPTDAISEIKSQPSNALLSEIYPGDMREATNSRGQIIGIEGNLGVQYGLQMYVNFNGSKVPIARVQVDALDLPISAVAPFEANSKLLLCLINKLKTDPEYQLMVSYVLPIKKVTAMLAIYNDMGFLSATGEVTMGKGDYNRFVPTSKLGFFPAPDPDNRGDWLGADADKRIKAKPGSIAFITLNERTIQVDDPYWEDETYDFTYKWVDQEKSAVGGNEGWQNYRDRQPGLFGGIWIKEWDSWDRVLLRKSKAAIKGIFKGYYTHRDFDPQNTKDRFPGSKLWIDNLKARMFPSPGQGLLPWFRRGKIRGNPFNAEGKLCDKPDSGP